MTDRGVDSSPKALRKFGLLFGALAFLWGAYQLYRGHTSVWGPLGVAAALVVLFAGTGLFLPRALKPIHWLWMQFAFALAWVNTRVILGIFFYLILTPIGLVLRLTGKDLLGKKVGGPRLSYWERREPEKFDRERYRRMF